MYRRIEILIDGCDRCWRMVRNAIAAAAPDELVVPVDVREDPEREAGLAVAPPPLVLFEGRPILHGLQDAIAIRHALDLARASDPLRRNHARPGDVGIAGVAGEARLLVRSPARESPREA